MKKIGVLIVDDSAVVRQVTKEVLERDPAIEVLAVAPDPLFAYERMKQRWPDVVVLDLEMPRMDGLTFLKQIMQERPTPIIICSTLTEKGSQVSMDALANGAFAVINKPKAGVKNFLQEKNGELIQTIKAASNANVRRMRPAGSALPAPPLREKLSADAVLAAPNLGSPSLTQTTERVIAIGTSTGGTQALETVLTALPRVVPGIVIVQHMPEKFTGAFASRLNSVCAIEVKEAENNDRVLPGRALIAPGGKHMLLKRNGAQYCVEVVDGPLVNRHRPSVDVLFRSVAKFAGRNALGIIMTGMGDDGARGLKEMRDSGAHTVGQDEASCVVYGMPKEAAKIGAVTEVLSLNNIPTAIVGFSR